MAQQDFDAFVAGLKTFAGLWQSGTISWVAVHDGNCFVNLATRIVYEPEQCSAPTTLEFVDLTNFVPPLCAARSKFPVSEINQLVYQIVATGRFQLMVGSTIFEVYLSATTNGQTGRNSIPWAWQPPASRMRSIASQEWHIDRPLKALVGSGQNLYEFVDREQINSINARLKTHTPEPFQGIPGLIARLMPGAPAGLEKGFVQIAAPLPFDLSYDATTGVQVEAPPQAFEKGTVVSAFFKPSGSERMKLNIEDTTEASGGVFRRWQGNLAWPDGATSATVELLYNDAEVDMLSGIAGPSIRPESSQPNPLGDGKVPNESHDRRSDWEELRPLGEGGQSQVFLVRRPARLQERANAVRTIMVTDPRLVPKGQDPAKGAAQFAEAIFALAHPDTPAELGAMKVFKLRDAGPEGEHQALARLKTEISVLRQKRPGLPELLAANESERWIVTEYFPEGTLEGQPAKYKGDPGAALKAFRSLVGTVASLHDEKMVHRDIKPANIFIRGNDSLTLGDFGIVYLPNQPDRQTRADERVGPRDYMPPWADRNQRLDNVEPNFDVYMLGKLLWCMVAGRLKLFREEHHSPEFDLAAAFPKDPAMHLINSILDRCIVLKPDKCLRSARELLPIVEEAMQILDRGGQLLSEGVPRPCHVCGKGHYKPVSLPRNVGGEPKVTLNMAGMPIPLLLFVCDSCGHVELFK